MVNYNAFNVDPNVYNQNALNNVFKTKAMVNDERQRQFQNILARDQQQLAEYKYDFAREQESNRLAQQRFANKLALQQQADTERRTGIYEKSNKLQAIGTALNMADSVDDPNESKRLFQESINQSGYGEMFQEGSQWIPSFNKKDALELPVGKDQFGNPQAVLSIKGTRDNRSKFLEAMRKVPTAWENPQDLSRIANSTGVTLDFQKGWAMYPSGKGGGESVGDKMNEYEFKRLTDAQYDINKMLSGNRKKNEFGEDVPLTPEDVKRLNLAKRMIQSQKAALRGRRPKQVFTTPEDLETAFGLGMMRDRDDIKSAYQQGLVDEDTAVNFWSRYPGMDEAQVGQGGGTPVAPAGASAQAPAGVTAEGAENPVSKIINELWSSGKEKFSSWNDWRKKAKERISKDREKRLNAD